MKMSKSIYIYNSGELHRKDNTLYFETQEGKKYLPIEQLYDIYIFGEVNASKKFLDFCATHHIAIHYFNYYGYYSGSFYPREYLNSGFAILKQAEFYLDMEKRLPIAKKFIQGAYQNIRQVLKYYSNRSKEILFELSTIESMSENIKDAHTIESLMGTEGGIREIYYQTFDKILENDEFIFEKRSRRPPQNRLNALISFGNSLLYTIVLSEIYKTQLDPRIGYLHSTNFRSFSLNLDIAEIFKPIIIDRTILKLISKNMLQKKHFIKELDGILLNEEGRKLFTKEIDGRLEATLRHKKLNRNVSYRRIIRMEIYKLQKHLIENQEYKPFVSKW